MWADEDKNRFNDMPEDDWPADAADAFQGLGMVWLTKSIGGKRLGRTRPVPGNVVNSNQSSYRGNTLTRGLKRRVG